MFKKGLVGCGGEEKLHVRLNQESDYQHNCALPWGQETWSGDGCSDSLGRKIDKSHWLIFTVNEA